ncbi:class I SAM-dependent RNA methyltransferase [Lichenifustis flavocetrariae]|uniref:RNA methyltransferase n=1 Tax=Lichenifustis flavocetrariae TaxID=2949735 RepID=A0AA42CK28_9HYPH|nr:RNA methyltransferase [Lichenifustis flavocetrariae]MCW6510158.1 RNA methyltransferase [Lichenifustis flavocetrariae]
MRPQRLEITRLGQRGEGVAVGPDGLVYIPFALPGETVLVESDGEIAHVIERVVSRPDRMPPICAYFETCGGCAVQALPAEPYRAWKHGLVVDALRKAGLDVAVAPVVAAHGAGRRRATFHGRAEPSPNVLRAPKDARVGFMRARSHEVIDIASCPVLDPTLAPALLAARRLANRLLPLGKPLDLVATATATGLDIDMRGLGPLDADWSRILSDLTVTLDLARLSNHGDVVIERRSPILRFGKAELALPPGAFLQATELGEDTLAGLVREGIGTSRKVADLFCGLGTFALRLAEHATVRAYDLEGPSLAALSRAARMTPVLRPLATETRDLFRRPLRPDELAAFDAVVFDPPRAGALAQAEALAASTVPTVVAVSCNPVTFARDAAILVGGGYRIVGVTPVDQFLYSPHVELVGVFRRPKDRKASRRSLFG